MTRIKLQYVHRFRDRHGRERHYFRRPGYPRVALPGLPGSAEFMRAYEAALAGRPLPVAADRTAPGSMAALAVAWFASADFKRLRPTTQRVYRRVVDRFLAEHGDKPAKLLAPKHVRALLDAKAATPAAANRLLSILRLMLGHAVERGLLDSDPTVGVRWVRYRKGGFATWTEADIAAFQGHWAMGTRARLAFDLLLYTGQRRSDVIRMGPQHIKRGKIAVRQQKTDARLMLPIHPALRVSLAACPAEHLTFLTVEGGRPFASGNSFYNWFVDRAREAGIEKGLSPHGLRKAAARRLAEARCSPFEIMAITGHATLAEVQRYARAADQERLAEGAMARIGKEATEND